MALTSKTFKDRVNDFFMRHGHWIALGLCLTMMAGAAVWIGLTDAAPSAEKTPGYGTSILAGQEPDIVDRLDLVANPTPTPRAPLLRPVSGETLRAYSAAKPIYNAAASQWATHEGTDIAGKKGDPVIAAASGTVTGIERDTLMGCKVTIHHGDGLILVYSGLGSLQVAAGDAVRVGETIGILGVPDLEADLDAHLHLEAWMDGNSIDPETIIAPPVK